jgi:transposase
MRRAPQYRPTLVDPYRNHLRARREQDPAVPVQKLLAEIKEPGYTGSQNLLYPRLRHPAQPDPKNDERLDTWIAMVRPADLPHLYSFCTGLDQDRAAVEAGLTLPSHNGGTEGVNNKTKMIKRQMYGRAGFRLLRHRILLG